MAILMFELRNNGYGVKLAAWCSAAFWIAVAGASILLIEKIKANSGRRWAAVLVLASVFLASAWNWQEGVWLAYRSLLGVRGAANVTAHYRLSDFTELRTITRFIPPDEKLFVAVDERVVQDWVVLTLQRLNLALNPMFLISAGPDELAPAGFRKAAMQGWETANWILTLRHPQIVGTSTTVPPVWQNERFALYRRDQVRNLFVMGGSWYTRERNLHTSVEWQHDFRWLRNDGEILVFFGDGTPLQLEARLIPGRPSEAVQMEWLVDGQPSGRFDVLPGGAVFRSPTIYPHGSITRILLRSNRLPDLTPRRLTLRPLWSPVESRRLTVALAQVSLLTGADLEREKKAPPLRSYRFPAPKAPPPGLISGIYDDGWISPETKLTISACGSRPVLKIDGHLRGDPKIPVPFPWTGRR